MGGLNALSRVAWISDPQTLRFAMLFGFVYGTWL